jgi:hypothetical protein
VCFNTLSFDLSRAQIHGRHYADLAFCARDVKSYRINRMKHLLPSQTELGRDRNRNPLEEEQDNLEYTLMKKGIELTGYRLQTGFGGIK